MRLAAAAAAAAEEEEDAGAGVGVGVVWRTLRRAGLGWDGADAGRRTPLVATAATTPMAAKRRPTLGTLARTMTCALTATDGDRLRLFAVVPPWPLSLSLSLSLSLFLSPDGAAFLGLPFTLIDSHEIQITESISVIARHHHLENLGLDRPTWFFHRWIFFCIFF